MSSNKTTINDLPTEIIDHQILEVYFTTEPAVQTNLKKLRRNAPVPFSNEEVAAVEKDLYDALRSLQKEQKYLSHVCVEWNHYTFTRRSTVFCDCTRPIPPHIGQSSIKNWGRDIQINDLNDFTREADKYTNFFQTHPGKEDTFYLIGTLWLNLLIWDKSSTDLKQSFDNVLHRYRPTTLVLRIDYTKENVDVLDVLQHCTSVEELRLSLGKKDPGTGTMVTKESSRISLPNLLLLELDSYMINTTILQYLDSPLIEVLSLVHSCAVKSPVWDVSIISSFVKKYKDTLEACFLRGDVNLSYTINTMVENLPFPMNLQHDVRIFKIELYIQSYQAGVEEEKFAALNEDKSGLIHSWSTRDTSTTFGGTFYTVGWNTHTNIDHMIGKGNKFYEKPLFELECDHLKKMLKLNLEKSKSGEEVPLISL